MNPTKKQYAAHWKKIAAFAAGAVMLAVAQNGLAGSLSVGTLTPIITLSAGCTVLMATDRDFGIYATNSNNPNNIDAGQINVICPLGLSYRILMNGGQNPRPALFRRQLKRIGFSNLMRYNLKYLGTMVGDKNALLTEPYTKTAAWVNGIGPVVGTGFSQLYPLTADIQISSSPIVGIYTDSVAVTVQW